MPEPRSTRAKAHGGQTPLPKATKEDDTSKLDQARKYEASCKKRGEELPYNPYDLDSLVKMGKYGYWVPPKYKNCSMSEVHNANLLKFLYFAQDWKGRPETLVSFLLLVACCVCPYGYDKVTTG